MTDLPGMGQFAGDPQGIDIHQLKKPENILLWDAYVNQQAELLYRLEKDPDCIEFGYLQHRVITPMYGRAGSPEFQKAREAWNTAVISRLRHLYRTRVKIPPGGTLKETYISPFDGQLK